MISRAVNLIIPMFGLVFNALLIFVTVKDVSNCLFISIVVSKRHVSNLFGWIYYTILYSFQIHKAPQTTSEMLYINHNFIIKYFIQIGFYSKDVFERLCFIIFSIFLKTAIKIESYQISITKSNS